MLLVLLLSFMRCIFRYQVWSSER